MVVIRVQVHPRYGNMAVLRDLQQPLDAFLAQVGLSGYAAAAEEEGCDKHSLLITPWPGLVSMGFKTGHCTRIVEIASMLGLTRLQ